MIEHRKILDSKKDSIYIMKFGEFIDNEVVSVKPKASLNCLCMNR